MECDTTQMTWLRGDAACWNVALPLLGAFVCLHSHAGKDEVRCVSIFHSIVYIVGTRSPELATVAFFCSKGGGGGKNAKI